MDDKFCFVSLLSTLPPVIARKKVSKYFGGAVSAKTLANADYLGQGPKERIKIGRDVCYPTSSLLEWLDERSVVLMT